VTTTKSDREREKAEKESFNGKMTQAVVVVRRRRRGKKTQKKKLKQFCG
jgi:hypothetical protein